MQSCRKCFTPVQLIFKKRNPCFRRLIHPDRQIYTRSIRILDILLMTWGCSRSALRTLHNRRYTSAKISLHNTLVYNLCFLTVVLANTSFSIISKLIVVLSFYENTCCGYLLEAPHRGASNKYPQHMCSWKKCKTLIWTFFLSGTSLYKVSYFHYIIWIKGENFGY